MEKSIKSVSQNFRRIKSVTGASKYPKFFKYHKDAFLKTKNFTPIKLVIVVIIIPKI